jgi:hypothetical protein
MFRRDPAFSMASCIRTDFTNVGGVRDNPAPIYEVCVRELAGLLGSFFCGTGRGFFQCRFREAIKACIGP